MTGWAFIAAALALGVVAAALPAGARIGLPGQDKGRPLDITADGGIEWQQKSQAYIARENVRAAQGDIVIHADLMTAFYRKSREARSEVWRINASGNVRIASPQQTAYGDKAVYDVDDGVLVLTGRDIRLVAGPDKILARRSLEFWEHKNLAVARGDAIAVRGEHRMRADVLTAHFVESAGGSTEVKRIHAFDNVLVSSPTEIVRADRGIYNLETGIVMLSGSVKITRGKSQLNGEFAEVNMETGVSRLYGGDAKRVRGYFSPDDAKAVPGPRDTRRRK